MNEKIANIISKYSGDLNTAEVREKIRVELNESLYTDLVMKDIATTEDVDARTLVYSIVMPDGSLKILTIDTSLNVADF